MKIVQVFSDVSILKFQKNLSFLLPTIQLPREIQNMAEGRGGKSLNFKNDPKSHRSLSFSAQKELFSDLPKLKAKSLKNSVIIKRQPVSRRQEEGKE